MTSRFRIPANDPVARCLPSDALAEHQVAGLTALESAVMIVSRALVATYPHVSRLPREREHAELRTARRLLDDCEGLLVSLDAHRREVSVHLHTEDLDQADDRPF